MHLNTYDFQKKVGTSCNSGILLSSEKCCVFKWATLEIQQTVIPVGLGAGTGFPSKAREERRRRNLPTTRLIFFLASPSSLDLPGRARYEDAINGDKTPMESARASDGGCRRALAPPMDQYKRIDSLFRLFLLTSRRGQRRERWIEEEEENGGIGLDQSSVLLLPLGPSS
jgi:hypothetical protein